MLNVNTIIITGRLVDKIAIKSSSDGSKHFATYTLANTWYNSKKTAEDGTVSYEPHTDFYDCVESIGNLESYNKKAEALDKGHEMHILGKLTKKTSKKEDGSSATFYSVRVLKGTLNYACFDGRVVADGTKYASKRDGDNGGFTRFRIASNSISYKNKNGEWVNKSAFVDVRMNVFNYEKFIVPAKGDEVLLEGYFETEEYQSKEGENRSRLVLVADTDTYSIIRKEKPEAQPTAQPAAQQMANDFADEDIPF